MKTDNHKYIKKNFRLQLWHSPIYPASHGCCTNEILSLSTTSAFLKIFQEWLESNVLSVRQVR